MSSTPPETPAGWYPDQNQPGTLRYWDGQQWTEHTHGQPTGQGQVPAQVGYQTYSPGATAPPNNHLVMSIITALFCCQPFGIAAVYKASRVNVYWESGQYDAARKASDEAKKWWIVSMIIVLSLWALYFVAIVAIGAGSSGLE